MEILTNTSGVPKKIILRSHTLSSDTVDEYLAAQKQETVASATAPRVGYVQIQEENNGWRNANMQSIHKAARDFGVDLTVAEVPPALEEQIIRMREFIEQDMDVIVLTPGVESGWDEVLQEAKDAGIPVLLSDRKVDSSIELYTSFIGADFLEEGRPLRAVADAGHAGPRQGPYHGNSGLAGLLPDLGAEAGLREHDR